MASTTRTRSTKRAPTTRRSNGGGSSRGRTGARNGKSRQQRSRGGSRGGGGGSRRPGLAARAAASVRTHVGDQSQDAIGIGLILLGVLTGLGMYVGAAGPVGDFLEAVFRGLLGVFGFAMPVALAWLGVLVVIGRPAPDIGRVVVGAVICGVGCVGGWHLLSGLPEPALGVKALWPAGGLLGWTLAAPLETALSVWGAGAVFVAALCLGLLIVTRTPFSEVLAWLRTTFLPPSAPEQEAATPSRRAARGPAATDRGGEQADETRPTPVRATLAKKAVERSDSEHAGRAAQPELEGLGGDQTAADRLAGRAPRAPQPSGDARPTKAEKAKKAVPVGSWDDYQLPTMDLLARGKSMQHESQRHIEAQVGALQETFDQFGIDAGVARWSRGPTVTRFEIELGPGVQVKKVANMGDDIAYALAAPDVRIVAPIPGKSAIGVEVPNRRRDLITLGDILRSDEARQRPHPLEVALGVDIAGNPALINLTTMPHLLVSGATGSGKSVTLNGIITSVVMRARPDQVRMILIDPKRVELNHYAGAPHLLAPVVTDPRRATDAVQWCVKEMENRYELLAQLGFRNIEGYNEAIARGEVAPRPAADGTEIEPQAMPYVLLVIDELADLMLVAPRDVEEAICRIAQMARAVGIHMIIATQRPSVDVITGLIKANIPSRLSLAVASQTDSRTILDGAGAEKLVGDGDMLFLPASQGKPSRLQGCFVAEREISAVVQYCRAQREAAYVDGVVKEGNAAESADRDRGIDDDSDQTLTRRAAQEVVASGLGSTSMLQRKLRVGFARAGRIMDELEQIGVVGANEGSKARDVLWSPEDLDNALEQGLL